MSKSEKTSLNISSFKKAKMSSGKAMGKTDMGIPPFTQKPKNVQMLSAVAKTSKGKKRGSDMYC